MIPKYYNRAKVYIFYQNGKLFNIYIKNLNNEYSKQGTIFIYSERRRLHFSDTADTS